jgi:hypothetical protein
MTLPEIDAAIAALRAAKQLDKAARALVEQMLREIRLTRFGSVYTEQEQQEDNAT